MYNCDSGSLKNKQKNQFSFIMGEAVQRFVITGSFAHKKMVKENVTLCKSKLTAQELDD